MATDPITRQQLIDAATDADTLAQVVNNPSGSVVSRLGRSIRTISQVIADAASAIAIGTASAITNAQNAALYAISQLVTYNPRGNWVMGTAYAIRDTAISGGVVYYATVAHTASGSFATDLAAGKWAIMQGVVQGDLGSTTDSTKGANLVGYRGKTLGIHLDDSLVFLNCHMTQAMSDAIRRLDNPTLPSGISYVGMTCVGDSFGNTAYTMGWFARAMQEKYGVGATFSPGFGAAANGAAWTATGGAAGGTDYTYFPGSNQITMPVGSTLAMTNSAGFGFPSSNTNDSTPPNGFFADGDVPDLVKVTYVYLKRPGDGQLTFTTSQKGVDAANYPAQTVDCNGALDLGYVDVPVVNSGKNVTVGVSSASATCLFVGCIFWRKSGVLYFNSNVGGSRMDDQKLFITNGNYSGPYLKLLALLKTKLVIHSQRALSPADSSAGPNPASVQANYNLYFDTYNALGADASIGGLTQLILGEQPITDPAEYAPGDVTAINKFLRGASISRSFPYIDSDMLMNRAMTLGTQLGWNDADTVHWDPPYHRWATQQIGRAVDWFRSVGNRPDLRPVTRMSINDERFTFFGFDDGLQDIILGNGQSTVISSVKGGTASFTASQSAQIMTVTAVASGTIYPGQTTTGTGALNNNTIAAYGTSGTTGTGGVGTYALLGSGGTVASGAVTSDGGYGLSNTDANGFRVAGGAGLGYISALVRPIPPTTSLNTNGGPWTHSIQGYRNLVVGTGLRAFILFGVNTAKTTLTTLNERCYGIEFAKGSDVGTPVDDSYPAGQAAEVMRLICYDGANTLTSEWTTVLPNGAGGTSTSGCIFKLEWDFANARLVLYTATTAGYRRALVLPAAGLKTAATGGSYINIGVIGENAGNVPTVQSSCLFSFRKLVSRWSTRTFQPYYSG